jgi:hypothetical protein
MKDRTKERTRIIYKLRMFDEEGDALVGTLVDITPLGVMIIGKNPIEAEREFSLRMELPKNVMAGDQIEFRARCKWCRKNEPGNYFGMGFQFIDLRAEDKPTIAALMKNFCQEEDEEDCVHDMNPPLP